MSKFNWINTSPNSGNGNGSIQVTAQVNENNDRQGSVVVAGGGLSKTIAVNQYSKSFVIGKFDQSSDEYPMGTNIRVDAIGIKGTAYYTMDDMSVVEKEFTNTTGVIEFEHCSSVLFEGKRFNDTNKLITFDMQTTLSFTGFANNLCKLFTGIHFNSTRKNTLVNVIPFYEELVYEMNECLMTTYRNNNMFIRFHIVDFDEATKERIRSIVTWRRFAIDF